MEVPANERGKSGAHLLHIVGSPRKDGISASIDVAERFIEAWMGQDASRTVYTLDVWKTELPSFDGAALEAKYASLAGIEMSGEAAKVWGRIGEMGELFHAADVIVMGVPMWNFGIPYRLKHLIDAVTQKNVLYKFDGQNLIGTLVGRKLVVVAERALAATIPRRTLTINSPTCVLGRVWLELPTSIRLSWKELSLAPRPMQPPEGQHVKVRAALGSRFD